MLLDSNIQSSTTKNHKAYKEARNIAHSKAKKKKKINRNCPEKDPMANLLGKDVKITALKTLKETKLKVKKTC